MPGADRLFLVVRGPRDQACAELSRQAAIARDTLIRVRWLVPLLVLTCWFSFFGAVATHNTVHSPVFHQRWLNRVFQVALTLTYGHPVSAYVPGHNLSHHKYTQTRRDVMRTSKLRYRWNLLNQILFFHTVSGAIIGAASVNGLKSVFTAVAPEFWLYALGGLFVLVTLFLPEGLTGLARRLRRTRTAEARA